MAAETHGARMVTSAPRVPYRARSIGLRSVFTKTLRDSRVGIAVISALLGGILLAGGATMATSYGTTEARLDLTILSTTMPPILRGLYGDPVNVDTLGGFVSWHYGGYFALLAGLWSILALSSTLAGEAARGSLDLAVVASRSRRRVAWEKVAGHVTALAIAMALVAIVAWATGAIFATLDRDDVAPSAAIGFAIGLGLRALIAGSIAFALAPLVGRGVAAGAAGAVMFAGYVINSYHTLVPAFDALAGVTWFSWSAGHVPLAGSTDWLPMAAIGLACLVLLTLGVEAFRRRDIGVTIPVPLPRLPSTLLGIRGPLGRSLGDLLPAALAWGAGLGLYGIVMATSARPVADALASSPGLVDTIRSLLPGVDIATTEGFLQLAFVDFGFVLMGLVAATLIAGRCSDEAAGRLELQLATPLTRTRLTLASATAVWLAIAVVTILLGAAIALGIVSAGDDPVRPTVGLLALFAYGAAIAGVGVAVAGLFGPSVAAPVAVGITIGTFLTDLLAPALRLPDWVEQLALTTHLGQPMVGVWDPAGMVACLALALGGAVIGALGMSRRDVRG